MRELTVQEACTQPANFMYLWADEQKFLRYIPAKHANVIRTKKANQIKLLKLSAEKTGDTFDKYVSEIQNAFVAAYGMQPYEALVVLAQGGQVAGKNWKEGVYGIGAVLTFAGHADITVRETDGHILKNGADITDESKTVYATVSKKTMPYQLFGTDGDITYMSQLNKVTKKYKAQSFSDANGSYNARTGSSINSSDQADIWGAILASLDKFIQWIISIFGGDTSRQTLTTTNTLPSQVGDGFVTNEASLDPMIAVALLGGGAVLLGSGVFKKGKKKFNSK